jgi:hypothetical protein
MILEAVFGHDLEFGEFFYNQTPFCFLFNRSILMSVVDYHSSHLP